ncbi:hypothetical protein BVX99_01345 [bacterium F16]|nr:hypothetical protein BVX99_01345 [bacterium F16]
MKSRRFTLIELLIAITILLILCALLLPVLIEVKYKAKLVVCMNNQKQLATSAIVEASENNNRFSTRAATELGYTAYGAPDALKHGVAGAGPYDDRPNLEYISVNTLKCPFLPEYDYTNSTETHIRWGYSLYFGWRLEGDSDANHMTRIGQQLTFNGNEFDIMIADMNIGYNGYDGGTRAMAAHPDRLGTMALDLTPGLGRYKLEGSYFRGPVDLTFTRTDGSAFTIKNVAPIDSRLTKVRFKLFYSFSDDGSSPSWTNQAWSLLPSTEQ